MKRAALTTLALTAFIVENSFDFVGSVPHFRRMTGGLGILDILPLPDPERAHRALALLGDAGRHQYAVLLVTFDILFPLTLALFFNSWLSGRLRWLPWATLALDYAENLVCGILLATFPHESRGLASLAGVLTALKLAGYAGSLMAVGRELGVLLLARIKRPRSAVAARVGDKGDAGGQLQSAFARLFETR